MPSLKKLAKEILNIDIQQDHHDSVRVLCVKLEHAVNKTRDYIIIGT